MEKTTATFRVFGKGFNYSEDGPGNRLVYHLSGCNLHCPWCSNPDGMSYSAGKSITLEELYNEVLTCRPMFFDGGGITLTGGEVGVQGEAAAILFSMLRKQGVHTCVETNASLPQFSAVSKHTDYLIADFKHPDADTLHSVTGADINVIKTNLESRVRAAEQLHIRVTLIHGFNDSKECLNGFVDYFKHLCSLNLGCAVTFELLRYHEYGKEKWEKLGMPYTVENGFVSDDTVRLFADTFARNRLRLFNT